MLNRPEIVSPATRERVLQAIHELGFVRNEVARHLRAGRSRTVGLIVLDVANPFFADVAQGAEAPRGRARTTVVLCNSADDPARERRHLDRSNSSGSCGILVTPVDASEPELAELAASGMPVVLVDRGHRAQCSVAVDDRSAARSPGVHLIERGHREIPFVGGPVASSRCRDRLEGARRAPAGAPAIGPGVGSIDDAAALSVAARAGRRRAHRGAARRGAGPTAAFCANDLLALGFLQAMAAHGCGAGRHGHRRLRRHRLRRGGGRAPDVGPPAARAARAGRRPAAAGGGGPPTAPAPAGHLPAGPGGAGVHPAGCRAESEAESEAVRADTEADAIQSPSQPRGSSAS